MNDSEFQKSTAVSASANAFVKDDNKDLPVLVRGLSLESADQIYHITKSIYQGEPYKSSRDVLIGRELRDELEINIGDKLTITTPTGIESTLTITGFYDLGVASINKSWVITNIRTVQHIFNLGNRMTSIEFTVEDAFTADAIANRIKETVNSSEVKIENWKAQNSELLQGLESQRSSSLIIQVVVILSMVTGIASVLVVSVLQKSRQVGILKAMGIQDIAASMIFIYQGFLLGLVGSVIGIALGIGLLLSFNIFNVNSEGKPLLDLYIDYRSILISWLIVVLASTFASIISSRKSLKLNPVDVIREG
ncbi:ABC transporter permease [Chloroflexota bacterium]